MAASNAAPTITSLNPHYYQFLKFVDGKKPKLTWSGSKEELGEFLCSVFDVSRSCEDNIEWSEDIVHNMASCRINGLVFKYYTTTNTLCIQGQGDKEAKRKLLDLLGETNSVTGMTSADVTQRVMANDEEDVVREEVNTSCQVLFSSTSSQTKTQSSTYDTASLFTEVETIKTELNHIKKTLNAVLSQASQPKENMQMQATMLDENKFLRSEITTLKMEKQSLITALSLVNGELLEAKRLGGNTGQSSIQIDKQDQGNTSTKASKQSSRNTDNERNYKPRSVFIIGDSIIKNLDGSKMSRNDQIQVKSFSGASTDDMQHYMKPCINKNPDEIVIHVGTNDIKSSTNPAELANKIISLGLEIKDHSEKTKVTISAVVQRVDNKKLNKKVIEVNDQLKMFSDDNDWDFIEHSNLNQDCFDNNGVHLNALGTKKFAANIIRHFHTNKVNT